MNGCLRMITLSLSHWPIHRLKSYTHSRLTTLLVSWAGKSTSFKRLLNHVEIRRIASGSTIACRLILKKAGGPLWLPTGPACIRYILFAIGALRKGHAVAAFRLSVYAAKFFNCRNQLDWVNGVISRLAAGCSPSMMSVFIGMRLKKCPPFQAYIERYRGGTYLKFYFFPIWQSPF